MPTLLRWKGYRAFFYSNERNEPPHVHVRRDDMEAKFWLADLRMAVNIGYPEHELSAILDELGGIRTN
ncbi:MAG: DUF4160 domain-containing protein [Hyphomicrobiales bacterium]